MDRRVGRGHGRVGGRFGHGEQVEVGFKHEFLDRRARPSFAVYQLDRTNIGIPDNNGVTQQIGSQRSRGFETELIAEASQGLRFAGSYAYNDAVLTEFSERVIVGVDESFFAPIDTSEAAPVKAPLAWPNISLSNSGAGAPRLSSRAHGQSGWWYRKYARPVKP